MNSEIKYTVSARGKMAFDPIFSFLDKHFGHIPRNQIDSVFGFAEKCTLYGGRPATIRQLSDADIKELGEAGIGFRIPITNHFCSVKEYKANLPFLEKYHKEGNSLIIYNDELAKMVRSDFPRYKVEASVIKNIKTHKAIDDTLKLYDTTLIPMEMNDKFDFLEKVEQKERVILFATAGCAYNCPARTCYKNISRFNKFLASENLLKNILSRALLPLMIGCSRRKMKRALKGMIAFDLDRFIEMGYVRFKLIRSRPRLQTCH